MLDFDQPTVDLSYRSSEEILAHPLFTVARMAFVDAVLGLYEGDPFLNRLLLEAARHVTFIVLICMHVRYDKADRATWPTLRLLKQLLKPFGLSSPRRLEDLVARLVQTSFLKSVPSQQDRRVHILTPSAKMMSHDLDWLSAHYLPLQIMFPDPGYRLPVGRDTSFQRAQRTVAFDFGALGAKIMASNQAMMIFLNRDAGIMILIKLIQMTANAGGTPDRLYYGDIGARFGISKSHVQAILQDAERLDLVKLAGDRGRFVELKPSILAAFDRFIADAMSGHDLLHNITVKGLIPG